MLERDLLQVTFIFTLLNCFTAIICELMSVMGYCCCSCIYGNAFILYMCICKVGLGKTQNFSSVQFQFQPKAHIDDHI